MHFMHRMHRTTVQTAQYSFQRAQQPTLPVLTNLPRSSQRRRYQMYRCAKARFYSPPRNRFSKILVPGLRLETRFVEAPTATHAAGLHNPYGTANHHPRNLNQFTLLAGFGYEGKQHRAEGCLATLSYVQFGVE